MTTSLLWYSPNTDTDKAIDSLTAYRINAPTNKIEAHLYFGMIPFWLVVIFFAGSLLSRKAITRWQEMWLVFALLSMIYATGWLMPVAKHLPGFSFFQGPGRYGLITTLAMALLAGGLIDRWYRSLVTSPSKKLLLIGLLLLTVVDLWYVSNWVQYSTMVSSPAIKYRHKSKVRQLLSRYEAEQGIPRMLAPQQNLPNLTGFAATPTYLGLSPKEYYDLKLTLPPKEKPIEESIKRQVTFQQINWLQQAGVTHILSYDEIDINKKPLQLVWQGADELLHRAAGRPANQPVYLYELKKTRGRVSFASPAEGQQIRVKQNNVNQITIDVTTPTKGRLILTDLAYPDWLVTIDDHPATGLVIDKMFRGVDIPAGTHTIKWQYRPHVVWWGAVVSLITILLLAGIAHVRYWHISWWTFLDEA